MQREKLIDLLETIVLPRKEIYSVAEIADFMIDFGVVVLPCKVGDTVYAAEKDPMIPLTVSGIAVFLKGKDGSDYERVENFDKTVFLTREEAETALKKMEARNEKAD